MGTDLRQQLSINSNSYYYIHKISLFPPNQLIDTSNHCPAYGLMHELANFLVWYLASWRRGSLLADHSQSSAMSWRGGCVILRLHRIYMMENTTVIQRDNTNIIVEPSVTLAAFFIVFIYKLMDIIGSREILTILSHQSDTWYNF